MVDECGRLLDILSDYQWKVKREVEMHEFSKSKSQTKNNNCLLVNSGTKIKAVAVLALNIICK